MGEFVWQHHRNDGFWTSTISGTWRLIKCYHSPRMKPWNRVKLMVPTEPSSADFFVGRGSSIQAAESGEDPGTGGTSTYWWCSPHKMLGFSVAQPLCFWRREDTWGDKAEILVVLKLRVLKCTLLRLRFAWKLPMFINGWSVRRIFPSNQWLEARSIRKTECPRRKPGKSDPKLSASECFQMMSWSTMERSRLISTFLP